MKQTILENKLLKCECDVCKINYWLSSSIELELDHKNEKSLDNRIENVRFVCLNCHSQTDTFRGRNKNSGKQKMTDQEILEAFKVCGNIRKTLLYLNVAPKGGNYVRVKNVLDNNAIQYKLYNY